MHLAELLFLQSLAIPAHLGTMQEAWTHCGPGLVVPAVSPACKKHSFRPVLTCLFASKSDIFLSNIPPPGKTLPGGGTWGEAELQLALGNGFGLFLKGVVRFISPDDGRCMPVQ